MFHSSNYVALYPPPEVGGFTATADKDEIVVEATERFRFDLPNGSKFHVERVTPSTTAFLTDSQMLFSIDSPLDMSEKTSFRSEGNTIQHGIPNDIDGLLFEEVERYEEQYGAQYADRLQNDLMAINDALPVAKNPEHNVTKYYDIDGELKESLVSVSKTDILNEYREQMAQAEGRAIDEPFAITLDSEGVIATYPKAQDGMITLAEGNRINADNPDLKTLHTNTDLKVFLEDVGGRGVFHSENGDQDFFKSKALGDNVQLAYTREATPRRTLGDIQLPVSLSAVMDVQQPDSGKSFNNNMFAPSIIRYESIEDVIEQINKEEQPHLHMTDNGRALINIGDDFNTPENIELVEKAIAQRTARDGGTRPDYAVYARQESELAGMTPQQREDDLEQQVGNSGQRIRSEIRDIKKNMPDSPAQSIQSSMRPR